MKIKSLFFENFPLSFRVIICLLLTTVTLPGFFVVEKFRKHQIEETELAKKQGREPRLYAPRSGGLSSAFMLLYGYGFNYFITTFAFAADMNLPYRLATVWLSFGPFIILSNLKKKKTKLFKLASSPYAFGFRGCVVAVGICGALYKTLEVETQTPTRELRFLSLCCFAYAAWFSCGVGSVGGWAAHPEYGELGDAKRLMLVLMQIYFVVGFILQIVAASFLNLDGEPIVEAQKESIVWKWNEWGLHD